MESAIIKYLCANYGSVNKEEFNLVAHCIFGDTTTVSAVIKNRDRFAVGQYNREKRLIAKTGLRLCRKRDCRGCKSLHLCKTYLYGECQFVPGRQATCSFSHDLDSEHNSALLRAHDLADLDKQELCVLLLQNDGALLPSVCFDYNNGEDGKCNESCTRMHICENYLQRGGCRCFRAHDFYEPQPSQVLQKSRIPNALMVVMKPLYLNKKVLGSLEYKAKAGGNGPAGIEANTATSGIGATGGDANTSEKCYRAHYSLPYSWEVLDSQKWTVLTNSESIEKDYCDPKKTYSTADVEMICFDTMTCGLQKARRLSSISSVLQPTFLLTTQWLWYWEEDFGNWNQYDSPAISSTELELKFQNALQEEVEFTAGSQAYVLSFQDMIQTNKRYGTKRLVRRRPLFMSSVDVQNIKTSKRPSNSLPHFQGLPRHWDQTQVPETGHKKVPLLQSTAEYRQVEKLFRETMKGFDILTIERIQNKSLWDQFQLYVTQTRPPAHA